MPELPEVETVRRGIVDKVLGRRIESVHVGRERTVRRVGREAVVAGLTGATIVTARRHGKYLLFDLDTGEAMMIHLRMSGRVLVSVAGAERPAHTHVVLGLSPREGRAEEMWFVDPRTFGEVVVYDPGHADEVLPELARLGPDPINGPFDATILRERLGGRRGSVKSALLDQGVVAGIGNIYADEVLHRCRLRHDRVPATFSTRTFATMAAVIVEVLEAAIEAGGSTLADTQYVDVEGHGGSFQDFHLVYGREGLPCLTCGKSSIRRVMVGGRSTAYCPRCQR